MFQNQFLPEFIYPVYNKKNQMSKSGIILEYHGPIDLPVIELLLAKLKKKTKELVSLNIKIRKRVYGVAVECLENIYNYSAINSSNDKKLQPHLTIKKDNKKIIVTAGNPVRNREKDKLTKRLDEIKQSNKKELKDLCADQINNDLKQVTNGAGLGLMFMALRSGNRISYSFNSLTNDLLYFEIKIILNIHIMRKLVIDQTTSSPMVLLDPDRKIYQISGESRPPDVKEFYSRIISWLNDFSIYLIKSGDMKEPVAFNFNFEYFNSSSGKLILDICKILAGLRLKGFNVTVNWHFEKEDVDMLEVGKEMSKIVKLPFEYIESGVN